MLPLIIEPEAFAAQSGLAGLLIIDLCNPQNYAAAHLAEAVHVHPSELISGSKPATGKLPEIGRLNQLFSRIGYSPDKHIVVYDDEGGGWAGRFIWTLDVVGHRNYSYINGGLRAWVASGLPTTSQVPEITPSSVTLTIHQAVIASKQDVLASIDDPNTLVWDARSIEEYRGTRVVANRGGHVPGAVSLDWLETMDHTNNLKLRPDLQELLNERGLEKDKAIITHCQTHHRSGLTYLIGKMLGYRIKAYDGSWSEWGNDPDTPIESG